LALAACGVIGYQHLRLESVKADRDEKVSAMAIADNRIKSIQNTAKLQRELATESAQQANDYQKARDNAQNKSIALARQLRSGAQRLQVNGQCVPASGVAKPGTDSGQSNGSTFRLNPDAESAYLGLAAGIDLQRAQVIGLQQRVRSLESRCKIGG
jgi:hypothetical protein